MNLILLTKRHGRPMTLNLRAPLVMTVIGSGVLLLCALAFVVGGLWSGWQGDREAQARTDAWHQEIARQRAEIEEARLAAREGLDALAVRLGHAHAHILRLDALGQRLTRVAELELGEFDFEQAPAVGGPEERTGEGLSAADFLTSLDNLSVQLAHRQQQLNVLDNLLLNRNLQRQVLPAGRPVVSGWISSHYGIRNDPFTGQRAHHGGIDFAGRDGSAVVAVAAGVVTYSGDRFGYGKMVEINHGNGYVTRYAHNRDNLVRIGDAVKKGDHIAHMGMTGRATAPHVHFEVLHNGRGVNPLQYIRAAN